MSNLPHVVGRGFEYRCRNFAAKIGYVDTKRQPGSGATGEAQDKGDVLASLRTTNGILPFLFEAKKTKNLSKISFQYAWLIDVRKKAKRMQPKRIPGVLFTGKNMPIYIMIDYTTYYSLFGNYKCVVFKELETQAKKVFLLRWATVRPMLKGQKKEKELLKGIKIPNFDCMMFQFDELTTHLKQALDDAESL